MKKNVKTIWLVLFLISATSLFGQDRDNGDHVVVDSIWINTDIFAINEPARMTLSFDLKAFAKNKYDNEYQKATLGLEISEADEPITKEVRVRARGNSRKKRCAFPPIRINIKKADVENKYLEDTKNIKLVTHCKNSSTYEKYILKEYLVYKLYNVITPNSFRVRLVDVDYIDTGKKGDDISTWAFLIEPEGLLDERLDGVKIDQDKLSQKYMNPEDMVNMALFNYMIGNTDFSITGRHNVKIMMPNEISEVFGVPIPYDFDYSGMVNATYAVPYEGLGLKSVKQRYYLGACHQEEYIQPALNEFLAKKDELMSVIADFEYLPERERKDMEEYLEEFFKLASRKGFIKNYLIKTCL